MNPQFPAAAGDQHRRHDDDATRREGGAGAGQGCRGPPAVAVVSSREERADARFLDT